MNLKDKLRSGQQGKTFNNNKNEGAKSLRDKFKKRSQTVLDKTYEERNEKSKAGYSGKPIFNQELMEKFNIEDFSTMHGDKFIEILPISFDSLIPYFFEIPVHFGVGFSKDAFICMNRYKNQRCFRCEVQAKMWGDERFTKDETVKLFPTDRACYLIWERTKELLEGETPDYKFKLWAAPKTKVHAEIQEKVRDKIKRVTIDISDINEDGDGRTIGFNIIKNKGDQFPQYKGIELIPRDKPIPDNVVLQLEKIIEAANKLGYSNCIEMFLNLPTYEEVKESQETENEDNTVCSTSSDEKEEPKTKSRFDKLKNKKEEEKQSYEEMEQEVVDRLEVLQKELETIKNNPLKWRKWCKENNYMDAIKMENKDEAIALIIDDIYNKEIDKISENDVNY